MFSSLRDCIRTIEERHARRRGGGVNEPGADVLATGWAAVDATLGGGLACGGLHEWLGIEEPQREGARENREAGGGRWRENDEWRIRNGEWGMANGAPRGSLGLRKGGIWRPPLAPLVHLAWRVIETSPVARWVVWIGSRCFPYPAAMLRGAGEDRVLLIDRSLFVAPRDAAARLWAMDLALRCTAVGAVIADGEGFDMAATRRLQLAAKNHGTLALLVRPPWERSGLSAAQTRWLVRGVAEGDRAAGEPANPRWRIELLRCKGVHAVQAPRVWNVEWDRAACTLHLSAALADSAGAAPAAHDGRRIERHRCRA